MSRTSKKNLSILHINSNYIYTQLHQNMIEALEKKRISNNVYVATRNKTTSVVECNENVLISECLKKSDSFFYKYKQQKMISDIQEKYNISSFDCIHAYTLFTDGNCAMELSKKYNIPYIVAIRNTDVNIFFKYRLMLRKKGMEIMKNAAAIFFLSEAYKEEVFNKYIDKELAKELTNKCYIIPNGIDDFWFDNLNISKNLEKKISKLNNKNINLIYAGRIEKNKNILLILKAISVLKKENWNVKFAVIGKIKDKRYYRKLCKFNTFNYLGTKKKEELIDYYRKADIFVMPSITETFGLVYPEAMSQGLPVIYTKGQGFDCQFEEGIIGYHVNKDNENDIVDAIYKICEDYEKMYLNCIKNVNKFNWNDIVKEYVKIYKKLEV